MKKIFLTLLIGVSLASCQQDNIAFVDSTKLINEYQEKIDVEAQFKTKADKFQKRADSLSRAFQGEAMEFENKSKSLSQTAAQEQYGALMQKRQAMSQQLQAEELQIQQEGQTEMDTLVKKIRTFVKDYGERNKYTYILGSNEAGGVLYGEKSKDITEAVLKELNAAYKK